MLTESELAELEGILLPALERHHLRLLAHGLRTLQAIAGDASGPPPARQSIAAWAARQSQIAEDAAFREAFVEQLIGTGSQLAAIADGCGCDPLALTLTDLAGWARQQADGRLSAPPPPEAGAPPPG